MFRIFFREKAFRSLKKIERRSQLKINLALEELRLGKFTSRDIEIVDIFLKKSKEDYRKRLKLFK